MLLYVKVEQLDILALKTFQTGPGDSRCEAGGQMEGLGEEEQQSKQELFAAQVGVLQYIVLVEEALELSPADETEPENISYSQVPLWALGLLRAHMGSMEAAKQARE
jgi:hypothetical protein